MGQGPVREAGRLGGRMGSSGVDIPRLRYPWNLHLARVPQTPHYGHLGEANSYCGV